MVCDGSAVIDIPGLLPRITPTRPSDPSWSSRSTTIPSAVAVALFAWLATKAVAKHGLSGGDDDADRAAGSRLGKPPEAGHRAQPGLSSGPLGASASVSRSPLW
jgi:hypothetical protein